MLGNSKTVSFTIGKEATITYDLYSHNTLVVPFHLSSALFRQKSSGLSHMEEKIIIFTKVVNFNAPSSVNKTQLNFLFKETVGCSCIKRACCVLHRCDECQNETKLFRGRKK